MTAGQTVNLCGSIAALSGALSFVLVYTLFAPWRRDRLGRLLVFKALMISAFMIVTILVYLVGDTGPLLLVRGALAAGFGVAMTYQAWLVCNAQMKGSRGSGDV